MNFLLWAAIIVLVIGFVWSFIDRDWGWQFPWGCTVIAIIVAVIGGCVKHESTPEYKAQKVHEEEAKKALLVPHVIREVDGCKVYRWRNSDSDHFHYFTKCPLDVTTEASRTESRRSGKSTIYETKTETIKTER